MKICPLYRAAFVQGLLSYCAVMEIEPDVPNEKELAITKCIRGHCEMWDVEHDICGMKR